MRDLIYQNLSINIHISRISEANNLAGSPLPMHLAPGKQYPDQEGIGNNLLGIRTVILFVHMVAAKVIIKRNKEVSTQENI